MFTWESLISTMMAEVKYPAQVCRSQYAVHVIGAKTILYLRSVDPRKLRIGVKYYTVHMYSMPYYTYGSTANFLFLGPTALIYIIKNGTVTRSNVVLEILKLND